MYPMTGDSGGFPRRLRLLLPIFLLIGAALVTSCGPSKEELMAMERARVEREARERAAEEARRKAEAERIARINAIEEAGNEAARAGQHQKALDFYREVLGQVPRYGDQDQRVRNSLIKVVRAMPAPPPVPDGVVRSMVRGETMVKMGGGGNFAAAAKEIEDAVTAAPWLADAYYNLGIVQEKAEEFGKAMQNLKLCLAAAPQSPNANAIQARIFALEVMQEDQQKLQSIAGSWKSRNGNNYTATLQGKKIRIVGTRYDEVTDRSRLKFWYVFDLDRKGTSLDGTVSISRDSHHGCNFPEETNPVSGSLREDGNYIKLEWKETRYNWTWQGAICTGVGSLGKQMNFVELVERTGK